MFEASLRVVNWNARILVIGFAGGPVPQIPANILLVKNIAAMGFYFGSWRQRRPDLVAKAFTPSSSHWWREGKLLEPLISRRNDLAEAATALELLTSRRASGKVLLTTRTRLTDRHKA